MHKTDLIIASLLKAGGEISASIGSRNGIKGVPGAVAAHTAVLWYSPVLVGVDVQERRVDITLQD